MASTKIQNLPLKSPSGSMKIPTGGFGDYSITVNSIGEFIIDTFNLATTDYVDNIAESKENRILSTGVNLSPVSQLNDVPDTNNDVIDEVAQALLNRMEWIKDNPTLITNHQDLTNRTTFNTHPSSSISHNGTSNVSIEIEELKNDILTINGTSIPKLENDILTINNTTIPELQNELIGKQDVIINDNNLSTSSAFSNVPSTNNSALNTSLQALANRDKFIDDKIKSGLHPVFDSSFAIEIGGYPLNSRVMLNNGDIVQSTVSNNFINPNNDMTGWRVHSSYSLLNGKLDIASYQKSTNIISAASGTADAITASYTPTITALTNGMSLFVRAGSANTTTTPTFTPNSGTITAKTIVKGAGSALIAGDIAGTGHWLELQYDSTLDKWVLLNPATGISRVEVNNTLTSTSTTQALSAAQGKVLNDKIDSLPAEPISKFCRVTGLNSSPSFSKNSGFSSVTRIGTGTYEFTMSTPMPDTDYLVMLSGAYGLGGASSINLANNFTQTTTKFRVFCHYGGDNTQGAFDPLFINAVVIS